LGAPGPGFAFGPETQGFLAAVRAGGDREWFQTHRAEYDAAYVEPAKAFVEAVAPALAELAPGVHAEPRILGSIFRINRDTRLRRDKRPYKDHLDFWFWEGERRGAVSGFYLRVTPDEVGIGAGAPHLGKDALERYRASVADPLAGAQLASIADGLERDGWKLPAPRHRRPPRGWEADG